jgi:diguanylate cyclase (GGDEF)-like protein/PAS domain S-box-containing protein
VALSRADHLIATVPDAVIIIDDATRLHYANPAAERLFGFRAEERLGAESLDLIHPDDLEFAILSTQTVMEKEVGTPIEIRVTTATGWRLVEVVGARYSDDDLANGIVLSLRDLTERRRWEVAGDDLTLFRTLLQNAAGVTMLIDPDGTVRAASAAITRVLGHDPGDVNGRGLVDIVVAADRSRFMGALSDAKTTRGASDAQRVSIDVRMETRSGHEVPFQLTIVNLLDDPTVSGLIVSGQDISELHEARQKLAHAAEHDDLTGLPNRALLARELAQRLGIDGPRATAVAFLDLDRFKIMNDLFGHDVGDEILVTVARRLKNTVRASDVVARFGGDEFVIIASVTSQAEIDQLTARLGSAVSEPMRLRTGPLQVFASIGLVVAHPGDQMEDVLTDADAAMYDAKNRSRNTVGGRTRPLAERRSLAEDIDEAFRLGQFDVHYQPIVDIANATTIALEALVRWRHPRRGLLLPVDFLDVIEDTRRDSELGDLVATTAMSDLREFRELSDSDLTMGVNVSMSQLAEEGFSDRMASLVHRSGVAPANVVIEVSERGLLDPVDGTEISPGRAAVQSMSDAGFRIAVDDFGTGYSSLSHLVSFPVDILKIDRSFVEGLGHDKSRESIVAALIVLAQAAGMDVVAEGVEQESQLAALRRLGCAYGQGFYFSRPLPTDEIVAELRARAILGPQLSGQEAPGLV